MRITLIVIGTVIGLFVGDILGQPRLYWHGWEQETVTWAKWTFGCGVLGAVIPLFIPLERGK
jgi:hypothetical protein